MVSPIKSRRPNSRRNSSNFNIPCLPPNQWMQLLLKISPAFWYGKIVKGKQKFTFQRVNCSEPNQLVVVRVLLRRQQGQWTTLLVNCVLCLPILDEDERGMNSWVLAIQPRTPVSGSTKHLFVRNKPRQGLPLSKPHHSSLTSLNGFVYT